MPAKKGKTEKAEVITQPVETTETQPTQTMKIKPRKIIGHEARTNRTGYLFILPFIVAFMVFNFWPTINTFLISFTNIRGFNTAYVFKDAACPVCSAGLPATATKGRGYIGDPCSACDGLGVIDTDEFTTDLLGNLVPVKTNCTVCNGLGEFRTECDACHGTGLIVPIAYNYSKLVKDKSFWSALGNTFIIWGFNFFPQLGIALILAIWLSDTRLNLAGKGLFRAIIYMPNLLMAASVALLFRTFFGAFGGLPNTPAHQFLKFLGIHWTTTSITDSGIVMVEYFNFFRSILFSRGLVAFIQWWMWYGHTLIMLMAGITSIPVSLYESAVVDGANSRQTSWYITLPLLRPMILYILVTSMIGGMQMFEIPFLLTDMRGAPQYSIRTTVMYQYNMAFQGVNDRAYGATISVGIFFVTIILAMLIYLFLQDRSELKTAKKAKKGGAK